MTEINKTVLFIIFSFNFSHLSHMEVFRIIFDIIAILCVHTHTHTHTHTHDVCIYTANLGISKYVNPIVLFLFIIEK